MLLRGRSKDRNSRKVTPPGPSYMSNDKFAEYLTELRNNRIKRPSGARPAPPSGGRNSYESTAAAPAAAVNERPLRPDTALSHRRAHSALSICSTSSRIDRVPIQQPNLSLPPKDASQERPVTPLKPSEVVPSATYIERGQRWMEKEEAVSLRDALEDMDIQKEREREEARLQAAAQAEASELVWQHRNPGAVKPEGPYRYKEHLRKNSYAHARTQSVGRCAGTVTATGLARDHPRSVSGGSTISGEMLSKSRVSSGFSEATQPDRVSSDAAKPVHDQKNVSEITVSRASKKSYRGLENSAAVTNHRRSSGKRNVSGEPAGTFSGEQIWEEPEDVEFSRGRKHDVEEISPPLRIKPRNPLNRVQFVQEITPHSNSITPSSTKRLSTLEIHQNPPSQSRNPAYTANSSPDLLVSRRGPDVPTKDGIDIRSDDIRQATSKSLRDRSPRLPTPAIVTDEPSRPIVSFDANWKPKEADLKPVEEPRRPKLEGQYCARSESKSLSSVPATQEIPSISVPTFQFPDSSRNKVDKASSPSIPTITRSSNTTPSINFPNIPRISISDTVQIPAINVTGSNINSSSSSRPLPDPKSLSSRPLPRHYATTPGAVSGPHWSPAIGNRATATCHQCDLPIEGRVVALKGLFQRFHPHCFICHTCGTGLEALEISPEPAEKRTERLDRIQRRAHGERLEELDGLMMADDGDERLRFYCHLDWHELFAPRCKHCKTPIIGEHAVALGEHWHYGHFFCAECGDPFEQGMTHIEKDGYAWCLNCQTRRVERRAPKCKKCKGPVIGQYIQALGGEFHDKCFKCANCGEGFDDGQIFPKFEGTEVIAVCVKCMERELKA